MARFFKKRENTKGGSPGMPIFIGEKKVEKPSIGLIDYAKEKLTEKEGLKIEELKGYTSPRTTTWINVDGLHDMDLIKEIGDDFGIHTLLLEDIVNTDQRPKIEDHSEYFFITLKMLSFDQEDYLVESEQLSFIVAKKTLITFQEKKGDVFDPVRERIRGGKGRIRTSGVDYLTYSLLDTVVDNYIFTIERIGEKIEDIEDDVIDNPDAEIIDRINNYKREINFLRKSIRPAKEAIMKLSRLESDIINPKTKPFLKDLEDLITQATEAIDTYRDMLSDQLNIYHTGLSNKMNGIMKILTVYTAIFIPLTFLTGVYGTNFKHFPEIYFKYSYPILWVVMIVISSSMLWFFKKKDWF